MCHGRCACSPRTAAQAGPDTGPRFHRPDRNDIRRACRRYGRRTAQSGAMTALTTLPQSRGIRAVFGPILFLLLWEGTARVLTDSFVLAGPTAIAAYLIDNAGLMWRALIETLTNAAAGFIIGNVAAVALAILAIVVPRSELAVRGFALLVFCL